MSDRPPVDNSWLEGKLKLVTQKFGTEAITESGLLKYRTSLDNEHLLGRGDFSIVFKVDQISGPEDTFPPYPVALKMFFPRGDTSLDAKVRNEMMKSFLEEANLLKECAHPAIARFVEVNKFRFNTLSFPVVVREFFPSTIGDKLEKGMKRSPSEVLEIINQVSNGAEYVLKSKNILLLDLRPGNTGERGDNTVAIMDLNMAWVNGSFIEPNEFVDLDGPSLPPELAPLSRGRSVEVHPRMAVYELGVLAHELLGGIPPDRYKIITSGQVIEPLKGISGNINTVLLKATDQDPLKRYQSIAEFRSALNDAIDEETMKVASFDASK